MERYPREADTPTLSFVIPVRSDARRLKRCLASIKQNSVPANLIEIIVVDNGSTDDTMAVAAASAHVLSRPGVLVGEVRNAGARAASAPVLAFVDADHEISKEWVGAALEAMRSSGAAAVGAPYHAPPDGTWVQRTYDRLRRRHRGQTEVEWLGSGNLVVSREAFDAIGGFNASLEACEDVDFCNRLRARGYRIVSDDRLKSIHLGDPSTLRALFVGELWRGQNNWQSTLRTPLSLKSIPSLAIPVAQLGLMILIPVGLLVGAPWGRVLALAALGAIVAASALRAARMVRNGEPWTAADGLRALSVALTYDVARALALVWRAKHHRRQSALTTS
jgi:GT2 family glycosyltransferase